MNCNGVLNGNSLDSYITFTAQPGVTYYIRVGGFASGSGQYTFSVNCSNGEGCTDTAACNYDSVATSDDGSCEYDSCLGCTDISAANYEPSATIDDGSCEYDGEGGGGLPPFLLDFELENLEMKAFPVPAEDQISISVDRLTRPGNLRVRMFSSDGRLLRTFSQAHGEGAHRFSEDISELAPGFYLIELNGYWGARTLSIIKR
jgi:hypothetical protein